MFRDYADILAVGISDKRRIITTLSVRSILVGRADQALKCLRKVDVYSLAGLWDLPDMRDGGLFDHILGAKSWLPTIAIVQTGNIAQEIAARRLGVTLVLPEDVDDGYFRDCLCDLLKINRHVQLNQSNNEVIIAPERGREIGTLSYTSPTPSWVCQSASDRTLVRPSRKRPRRQVAATNTYFRS
jgi:hypothetical protein